MRNSLWLACILIGLSASCEATAPSLDSLRCPTAPATSPPDTPAGGSDTSLFGSLTKDNNFNCIKNPSICSSLGTNFSCNMNQGCCEEKKLGRCNRSSDCTDFDKPVCDVPNNNCVACSAANMQTGDLQCSEWNTNQMDPLNRALCISGHCAECRTNSDCKRSGKTFCDQTDNICKGCTSHSQCTGSFICKLDASLLATGDALSNIGECVKVADVAFVDNNPANCDSAGAGGKPYCQINQAIAAGKSYINLKGNGGTLANLYQAVTVDNGRQVAILGPGRDVVPFGTQQAVINGVSVTGSARITLVGLSVTNIGAPAVQCNGSSTLYIQSVLISDAIVAPKGGIYANNCAKVDVERTKITGASGGYGLFVSGGSGHRIINNAIINNGSGAEPSGVRISGGADGLFAFNTIANNRQGVQCDSAATIFDSIVTANLTTPQLSANCQQTRVVTTGVELDNSYMSGNDPKLTTNAINDTCCIDKGMPDSNMTIKDDYFAAKRPLGNGYDIGFQEAK